MPATGGAGHDNPVDIPGDLVRTNMAYGLFYIHDNTTAKVIDTVDVVHAAEGFLTGVVKNVTFQASERGEISAAADAGGGSTTFTSASHGLAAGEYITLSGFSEATYNAVIVVDSVSGGDFTVEIAFVSDILGVYCRGTNLKIGVAGTYLLSYHISGSSVGANKDFEFFIFENAVENQPSHSERRFATGGDLGALGGSSLMALAVDDVVWFALTNASDATNFTMRNGAVLLHKMDP